MALIKEIKRETVRKEWRAISLLFAQLVVVVLIVFQVLQIVGLHVDFYLKQLAIKPGANPADIIVLAIAIVLFALLYLTARKTQPALFAAGRKAPGIIKEEARKKLLKIKTEPQAPALLLIEFMFVVVVVLAVRAYLDPELELIPWSRLGIGPPLTTIINVVIALLVLGLFYYLYSFTAPYRKR